MLFRWCNDGCPFRSVHLLLAIYCLLASVALLYQTLANSELFGLNLIEILIDKCFKLISAHFESADVVLALLLHFLLPLSAESREVLQLLTS